MLGLLPDLGVTETGEGITILGVAPGTLLNGVSLLIAAGFAVLLVRGKRGTPVDRTVADPVTGAAHGQDCRVL